MADDHLSPALRELSKTFRLSESLAGVTLLAFGQGAPDVFASLSASSEADLQGVSMSLSILIGSSLFTLTFATALVIIVSPNEIRLKKQFFLRDSVFLMIALSTLLFDILVMGQISLISSALFVFEYAVYVVFVIVQNRVSGKEDEKSGSDHQYKAQVEMTDTTYDSRSSNLDSPPSGIEEISTVQ